MKFLFFIGAFLISQAVFSQTDSIKLALSFETKIYGIKYPEEWLLDTSKSFNSDFFVFAPLEKGDDTFRENISLMIQNLKGYNVNLDQYVQVSEKQVNTLLTDAIISSSERVNSSGIANHKIVYTMTQGVFKLKLVQYYYIKDEHAYVITFTSEVSRFEQYIYLAQKIMNSFSLKN